MSILTKERLREMREDAGGWDQGGEGWWSDAAMIDALDTIDALERDLSSARADRDAFEGISKGMESAWESEVSLLGEIRAYALEHSTTRVIGGAHAALRKIAEMAGGEE